MQIESLLSLMEKNARIEVKDLAMALQESEENVLDTLSQLEKEKIICGYHTVINYDRLNKDHVQALIQVNAQPERDHGYERIARKIYRYPEVDTMYLLSGAFDFMVVIKGRTMLEVAKFVASKLATIENVTGTATFFVLEEYKNNGIILDDADEGKSERLVVTP